MLTPVDNPRAYGLVETDADGNIQRFLEKPGEDEITCNTINAGIYVLEPDTFDRIPKDTAWSIERSFFPSLIERGETFVAYVYDGYWIDIGTPGQVPAGPSRHHGRPLLGAAVQRDAAVDWVSPDARVEDGVELQRPCFIDEGAVVKAGARDPALLGASAARRTSRKGAIIDGSIIWPNGWIGRRPSLRGSILGRNCHVGRNAVDRIRRRARRQDRHHRLQHALTRRHGHQSRHLQGVRRPRPLPAGNRTRTRRG